MLFKTLVSLLAFTAVPVTQASPASPQLDKRIAAVVYSADEFNLHAQGSPIVILDNGVTFYFQNSDGNFVVYKNGIPQWSTGKLNPSGCAGTACEIIFQNDGNFVIYFNGVAAWNTGTGGRGAVLGFYDSAPWVIIQDSAGHTLWTA
jgi:hypothetical protein